MAGVEADYCENPKHNNDIKKEIKEWTKENLPNYVLVDSLQFEHSKSTGERSVYFFQEVVS